MGAVDPAAPVVSRPPESELGPLPPRSRAGVWWQFWFQWLFLTVAGLLLAAVFAVVVAISALSPTDPLPIGAKGHGRGRGELGYGDFVILSRSRYRLERGGTKEQWCARIEALLRKGITRADQHHAKAVTRAAAKGKPRPGPHYGTIRLTAGAFRGAGPGAVADVAERLGWEVDWERTVKAGLETVYVVRPETTAATAATA